MVISLKKDLEANMDLILHKKLLALQAENAALREQLEQLKETSPERLQAYLLAATTGKGNRKPGKPDTSLEGLRRSRDWHGARSVEIGGENPDRRDYWEIEDARKAGIERAVRALGNKAKENGSGEQTGNKK